MEPAGWVFGFAGGEAGPGYRFQLRRLYVPFSHQAAGSHFGDRALSRYLAFPQIHCLPLKLEEMPSMHRCFDTVMCMGILYHRRSLLDTLLQIHGLMVPGGQLVLETLVLEKKKLKGF